MPGLLRIANKNDKCLNETQFVFRKKYGTKWFRISGPFVDDEKSAINGTTVIGLKNFDVAKQFLIVFGKDIVSLTVDFAEIDLIEGKEIVKHINNVCSNSTILERISLQSCAGNVLDALSSVFFSVSTVWFSSGIADRWVEYSQNTPKLADIFPNTKTLRLDHTVPFNWRVNSTMIIGKTFPHLNDLQVTLSMYDETGYFDEHVLNFLKDNSKIIMLTIHNCNLKFLNETQNILPNLENLKIYQFMKSDEKYEGDPIRFEKVKTLKINSTGNDVNPEHIYFDQLHELELTAEPEINNKWFDFIDQQTNKNLSRLILNSKNLTNEQFVAIAEKKSHLKMIKIVSHLNISADAITQFINISNSLERMELHVLMTQAEIQDLNGKINQDIWRVDAHHIPSEDCVKNWVMLNIKKIVVKNSTGNGSSTLTMHSMQFVTIGLIYVFAKFF